ncbi:hypothetical protein E4U51_004249 [Claviceps purpurea]|nr:hypothetical protein E4U51_004249 [Claviceps purpurea]
MGPKDRYRYPEGSVAEIGERAIRVKPDFPPSAGHQAVQAPPCLNKFQRPYSTGPSTNCRGISLPPISSILAGPCPTAPILRGARLAASGSSVGVAYREATTDTGPIPWTRDDFPGSKAAQARRDANARCSRLSRKRKEIRARDKAEEMENKYKEANEEIQALKETVRRKDEESRRKDEEAQRIIRRKDEEAQRIIRQKDEEIERLKRGK